MGGTLAGGTLALPALTHLQSTIKRKNRAPKSYRLSYLRVLAANNVLP